MDIAKLVLEYVRVLIWPLLILALVLLVRGPVTGLSGRVAASPAPHHPKLDRIGGTPVSWAQMSAPRLLLITSLIVFILWVLTPLLTALLYDSPNERGQFGDLFGSANALFSGLAFAAVVVTIWIQQQQFSGQIRQLQDQTDLLQQSLRFDAWLKAQELFTVSDFIKARGVVFQRLDKAADAPWTSEELEAAGLVCRKLDELARLAPVLDRPTLLDAWDDPFAKAWFVLRALVKDEQAKTGWARKWAAFEELGEAACAKLTAEGRRIHRRNPEPT